MPWECWLVPEVNIREWVGKFKKVHFNAYISIWQMVLSRNWRSNQEVDKSGSRGLIRRRKGDTGRELSQPNGMVIMCESSA